MRVGIYRLISNIYGGTHTLPPPRRDKTLFRDMANFSPAENIIVRSNQYSDPGAERIGGVYVITVNIGAIMREPISNLRES